ncbi:MAG TPA: hypothetical protein VLD19_12180 [Chitinophagaceae bacterium]|nr:hypothetical protein [Chitinophagaceae bacterium]
MKKILLVFDGVHFSEGAFEFARQLNERQRILVTGVFLPQATYANLWSYSAATSGPLSIPLVEETTAIDIKKNIARFESLCRQSNMDFSTHKDYFNLALPELKNETSFADLVILGSETFYRGPVEEDSDAYLKEALHEAKCPILVVPEKFDFPATNILAYDGSDSSVFAIKQFAYLFSSFLYNETFLVTVKEDAQPVPNKQYIDELASGHFPRFTLLQLDARQKKHFTTWINGKKRPILVTGAFGRSFVSQLFKKSFISDIIQEHKLPVFIAHR